MNKAAQKQLLLLISGLLIIALSIYVGLRVVGSIITPKETPGAIAVTQPGIPTPEPQETPDVQQETKEYVPIVFIGKNSNGEEVYKVIKREYNHDVDGSKIRFAINSLIMGPLQEERNGGIYSEVPTNTNILHIYDKEDKLIIDLSSGFAYGGGTESVYKRLFQLIKTVKRISNKPAYLYIDGKQADVIGGDGIMITQPLSESSIGE